MNPLKTDLNGLKLKNPVTVASGTFGFGREYSEFFDLSTLGGISVKGLTLKERLGNPAPRIVETRSGMINSVGLQNPGVENFIREEIPFLRQFDTRIIVNINGDEPEDYARMAQILQRADIDSIEVNISCPNVKSGGMLFGTDPEIAYQLVRRVVENTRHHVMVKLTPNVTDIKVIARAVEEAGARAVSLVNTFNAMAIDIHTQKPVLFRKTGGLSGPAIKPIALRLVYEVYEAVSIPILGMGGITNAEDAIEFILAGASAVALGTYIFVDPMAPVKTLEGIEAYLKEKDVRSLSEIIGKAHE
ncbi:MAG: dihydroorotate dehydrogenase [delta proteobacterium ML8_F1]|nr:MAG: dihydroorotate dehydrogenase [delta proteobacterium ML8_F1]